MCTTLKRLFFFFVCAFMNMTVWAYSPYSNKELDELEQEFIQQINQSNSVLRDPLAIEYINHLGKTLAQHGHLRPPNFFIVNSNEINAFAGPGGHIGLNSQLILVTDNESQLAAVMSHEMAHVRLHHLYSMIEHQKQMRIPMLASILASAALGAINPTLASGALMASITGIAQDSINFTRAKEKEADRIGIDMLAKANFDPQAMAGFFRKMQLSSRYYYTAHIPAILRTHPLDDDRIAEAENRSASLKNRPHNLTYDYYFFKELVRTAVTQDQKQLLEYYTQQCGKTAPAFVCNYGHARTLLALHQYQAAENHLKPLLNKMPNNLYLTITLAEAELGKHQFDQAITRLKELQANYPDNYAAIVAYGQGLIAANQAEKARLVLLKGTRLFKHDLGLCKQLAQAEATAHHTEYAYFTQANCELLQGRKKSALSELKLAKRLAKRDPLLQARINAKIEEIKSE